MTLGELLVSLQVIREKWGPLDELPVVLYSSEFREGREVVVIDDLRNLEFRKRPYVAYRTAPEQRDEMCIVLYNNAEHDVWNDDEADG